MQKIYTNARNLILAIMAELSANHEFAVAETAWKATKVEEELVVFEIHERIKELLEKVFLATRAQHGEPGVMEFANKQGSIWEVTVMANGAESYFFARMLFAVLMITHGRLINMTELNCAVIERHAISAATRLINVTEGFMPKTTYSHRKKKYSITITVDGIVLTASNENPDMLCVWIGKQLRGCFSKA